MANCLLRSVSVYLVKYQDKKWPRLQSCWIFFCSNKSREKYKATILHYLTGNVFYRDQQPYTCVSCPTCQPTSFTNSMFQYISIFNSQTRESTFRPCRFMSGSFSSIVNFTANQFLQRARKLSYLHSIQCQSTNDHNYSNNGFCFHVSTSSLKPSIPNRYLLPCRLLPYHSPVIKLTMLFLKRTRMRLAFAVTWTCVKNIKFHQWNKCPH